MNQPTQYAVVAVTKNGVKLKTRKFYNRGVDGNRVLADLSTQTRLYTRDDARKRAASMTLAYPEWKGYEFGIAPVTVTTTTTLSAGKVMNAAEMLKAAALAKLTADEKKALGF